MATQAEIKYMTRALELAELGRGRTNPNPMVGAVIVKNGKIIGEGYHERYGEAHAEVNAFKNATEDVTGADMYVTLEPCSHYGKTPPCADLIIAKKIKRVVIGTLDPNPLVAGKGIKKLEAAGIETLIGVLDEENRELNEIFMKYISQKHPFVLLKSAMSLDGKIATVSGQSRWISNETSRAHAHGLRNRYMAIMVGIQTVLADNPELTCRLPNARNPLRIIVDSTLRIPEDARVLQDQERAPTLIAVAKAADDAKKQRLIARGIKIMELPGTDKRVDLAELFRQLGASGIDSVLVEGGATLAFSVLESGAVDKICCYIAPILLGGVNAPTALGGAGIAELTEAVRLKDIQITQLENDICVIGKVGEKCLPESSRK